VNIWEVLGRIPFLAKNILAFIIGSATPNELPYRAKRLKHPNNKVFDKSGVYLKLSKVAEP